MESTLSLSLSLLGQTILDLEVHTQFGSLVDSTDSTLGGVYSLGPLTLGLEVHMLGVSTIWESTLGAYTLGVYSLGL